MNMHTFMCHKKTQNANIDGARDKMIGGGDGDWENL